MPVHGSSVRLAEENVERPKERIRKQKQPELQTELQVLVLLVRRGKNVLGCSLSLVDICFGEVASWGF